MKPILLQGAQESEIDYFISKLEDIEKIVIGNFEFFKGKFLDIPVVVSLTRIGEINSAIATTIGVSNFSPKYIINQGTAGAHGKNIHKGEYVVGEKYVNLASYYTSYLPEGSGYNLENWLIKDHGRDEEKIKDYQFANNQMFENAKNILHTITDKKVNFGIIGSGDVWNRECDRILYLAEKYKTLCEEMEIAGVYKTANNFNIPVLGIRIISNNEILKEEYEPKIARECQKLVLEFVKRLEI